MVFEMAEIKPDITAAEFSRLLRDRVFVDYFNVFLSLPIFAQRVLYKYNDRDFLFDPPLKRHGKVLERRKLSEWLLRERLPHFMTSEIYLEYVICKELLDTDIKLTDSSHRLDYDELDVSKDRDLLRDYIGHVIGMCKLRRYLEGTTGELVLQFCKDAERFHRIPTTNVAAKRHLFRIMQVKYFRPGGIVCTENPGIWEALADSRSAIQEEISAADGWSTDLNPDCSRYTFHHLTVAMRRLLKVYWLPRYIIHCRALDAKQPADQGERYKVQSLSDLKVVQQLKDIDKALKLVQGNLQPCPMTQRHKAGVTWNALFPQCEVDDTFLTSSEDVVTMHADGRLVLEPMDSSRLEQELERYTRDISSSTSSMSSLSSAYSTLSWYTDEEDHPPTPPAKQDDTSRFRGETQIRPGSNIQNAIERAAEARRTAQHIEEPQSKFPRLVDSSTTTPSITKQQSRPYTCPAKSASLQSLPKLSQHSLRSQKSHTETNILTILPPIRETHPLGKNLPPELADSMYRKCISVNPATPEHDTTEAFRKEHQLAIAALTSDSSAGDPLKVYLLSCGLSTANIALTFWKECHVYLALQRTLADSGDVHEHIRFRRARMLILQYLLSNSQLPVNLAPSTKEALVRLLRLDKANGVLQHAQNTITTMLSTHWQNYCQRDREVFLKEVLTDRPPKPSKDNISSDQRRMTSSNCEEWPPIGGDQDYVAISERRMWRAIQFAMFIRRLDPSSVNLEALPLDQLEYEEETQEGSLAIKRLPVVRRLEIEEDLDRRRRAMMAAHAAKIARERAEDILQQAAAEAETDDQTPPFARPFRREGKWVCRPPKPRTFAELMRSSLHVEYFRRFLHYHGADTQVLFWTAVEDLKNNKDARHRQLVINQILRRYFFSAKRFADLDHTAEVIREIPKMERVTPAMLVSAQSCVARCLESRWFSIYMNTFPETGSSDISSAGASADEGTRKWGKEKTRELWKLFVKAVMRFREGILNPELSKLFCAYLRYETNKEIERQRQAGNTAIGLGVPVRKVIKNKLVDMSKLVADLLFLAEGERFRVLCDNATEAAEAGIYNSGDQHLLETKAKTIIDCFLDSDVPPRLQINTSQETWENIEDNFQRGMVDRGLFHDACMTIFPIMSYLWKKFQKYRIANMLCKRKSSLGNIFEGRPKQSTRPKTPDFHNINLDATKTIYAHHDEDEDEMRIHFSMSHGVRIARYLPRERESPEATRQRLSIFFPPTTQTSQNSALTSSKRSLRSNRSDRSIRGSKEDASESRRRGNVPQRRDSMLAKQEQRRRRSSVNPSALPALQNLLARDANHPPSLVGLQEQPEQPDNGRRASLVRDQDQTDSGRRDQERPNTGRRGSLTSSNKSSHRRRRSTLKVE